MTEIRLENPHSWFYVDVTDPSGKVTKWGFEGNTPDMGAAREIILADGRSFVVGPKGAADAN